jgi:hypothetical protein
VVFGDKIVMFGGSINSMRRDEVSNAIWAFDCGSWAGLAAGGRKGGREGRCDLGRAFLFDGFQWRWCW